MCRNFLYLLFPCFGFVNVNSMAIKGPALTRYDPCGLGIIHFDRITNETSHWGGVIYFGLYADLEEVEIEVYFEKPVIVYNSASNLIKVAIPNFYNLLGRLIAIPRWVGPMTEFIKMRVVF